MTMGKKDGITAHDRRKMKEMTPDQRREYNRLAKRKARKGPVYRAVLEALQDNRHYRKFTARHLKVKN